MAAEGKPELEYWNTKRSELDDEMKAWNTRLKAENLGVYGPAKKKPRRRRRGG